MERDFVFNVVIIAIILVLSIPFCFAQEKSSEPIIQKALQISENITKTIAQNPEQIVDIFINIAYDPSLQIRDELDASELGIHKREIEKELQETAATGVSGDSQEFQALSQELDKAELAYRQELARRLKKAYKPSQEEISNLVISLGGEVTSRYTFTNLLAVKIKAGQIPEIAKSPLVATIFEVTSYYSQLEIPEKDFSKLVIVSLIFLIIVVIFLIILYRKFKK